MPVQFDHVGKSYDAFRAVDDVSFEVREGEIFGLIGPNGAGKTTTMECIEGLRRPDSGTMTVLGLDPHRDATALRYRIGVQHQEAQLQKRIKVWEAVDLWASLYDKARVADVDMLLERLGLTPRRNARFMTLSGGQKQRLFIALALIHQPELVFLDELTTGLDPQARRAIWELVRDIRSRGTTVLLTTHLMEEAERLCDRVAIIDQGQIIALGTPREIQQKAGGESKIEIRTAQPMPVDVPVFEASEKSTRSEDGLTLTVYSSRPARTLPDLVKWIDQRGLDLEDIHLKRPTLEDVFIEITGKRLRD